MNGVNQYKSYIFEFSIVNTMVEPNWDYFINAPLDQGVIRFETKTERALHAKVVASEANWMECQSSERLITWLKARQDLEAFQDGYKRRHQNNP